jgi:hypothetical protein
VEKGQDLFGIAWIYRVELEDLLAANPEVNPNFLSIGAKLSIPASNIPLPSSEAPSPTPVPLQIGELNCTGTPEGGAWCFLPVFNPQDHALENVSAIIRLADREAVTILPQTAYLPLDVLPQAATLPLVAYFAPPLPDPFVYSAELVSALPHPGDDGRYLAAVVEDVQVEIAENGLSASVDCVVRLEDENASAQTVRVAAVAFDARGNVAGVRRWEAGAGQALTGEQPAAVQLQIYSVDERITRVEVLAETRP